MKRSAAPHAPPRERHVLLVSGGADGAAGRDGIASALRAAGLQVTIAEGAAPAAARLAQPGIALVALDLATPDSLRFLRRHASRSPRAPVVCLADRRQPQASAEALRLGSADVVGRPVVADDLLAALANALELEHVARDAVVPHEAALAEAPIGASPAMRDALNVVGRVATSRCSVLIAGERHTGRETIARAIHDAGPRRGPFIKIACSDKGSRDLERVLDGDVPEGATVYLEELCELALDAQVRFEEVLKTNTNGNGDRGVRFIASVPSPIAEHVERGCCSRPLVEALSVVRIDLPPLGHRPEDVPLLALRFLKAACRRNGLPPKTFSRGALTLLAGLPWRGNAGELQSLAERLAVLVPRGAVLLEDVIDNVRFDGAAAIGRANLPLREARERFERDYVTAVLHHHRGRIGAAARALGIERTNLYRKIKQLNIRWALSNHTD